MYIDLFFLFPLMLLTFDLNILYYSIKPGTDNSGHGFPYLDLMQNFVDTLFTAFVIYM